MNTHIKDIDAGVIETLAAQIRGEIILPNTPDKDLIL